MSRDIASPTSQKIEPIQGLRMIAALLVVFDHAILTLISRSGLNGEYQNLAFILGAHGVYLFFAISGFIMMHTSHHNFGKVGSSQKFIIRRILRITPFYWVCMFIYATKLSLEGNAPTVAEIVRSMTYIPYMGREGLIQPVYPLGWTLNYEMFFYVIFALSLFFRKSVGVFLTILVFLALFVAGPLFENPEKVGAALAFFTRPIILYFISGMLIFLVIEKLPRRFTFSLGSSRFYILCLLIIAVIPAVYAAISGIEAIHPLLVFIAITLVLFYTIAGKQTGQWDSTSWKTIKLLGDASFSIYLTHSFLLGPMGRVWAALHFSTDYWLLFCLIALVACSIFGYIAYIYVELPITKLSQRLLKPKRPVTV